MGEGGLPGIKRSSNVHVRSSAIVTVFSHVREEVGGWRQCTHAQRSHEDKYEVVMLLEAWFIVASPGLAPTALRDPPQNARRNTNTTLGHVTRTRIEPRTAKGTKDEVY